MKARRIGAAGASALLLVTTMLGGLVHHAPPASADTSNVQVVLDGLTPLIAQPGRTLSIRGRVANTTNEVVTDVVVQLRVSTAPLTARAQAAEIAESETAVEAFLGRILPQTSTTLPTDLQPRAQQDFEISTGFTEMDLPGNGTYVLSVEVLGRTSGGLERQGVTQTFLPWFTQRAPTQESADFAPIKVVWLWPLADWPARTANGTLLNNQTPTELSPGGRLAELVRIGSAHPVNWIADPALLQTAEAMTRGYSVIQDGQSVIGDRGPAAGTWLNQVRSVQTEPMWVMPYADIDASASRRADLTTDVVRAVTQAGPIAGAALGQATQPGAYWAPFGRIDNPTADLLASSGITTLILSAAAVPQTGATTVTPTGRTTFGTAFGALTAVLIDPTLATVLTAPQQTGSDALLARQRFLAETALIATEVGAPTDQTRTIVVGPRNLRWNPAAALVQPLLRATTRAPWMTPGSLDELLEGPAPQTPRDRAGYGDRARAAELPSAYLNQVDRVSDRVTLFTSVLDNPTGLTEPFSGALLRAQSAAWRTEPETARALLRSIRNEVNTEIGKVRVLASSSITFSGDIGRVPITIENDLGRSATVGVRLVGSPPTRLRSDDLGDVTVEAGKRASVEIEARVIGGDTLPVQVQLLTPDGADFGPPVTIAVQSTAYARAASGVVIAAFIALGIFVVVGVTRRIHRVQRGKRTAPSDTVGT